MKALICAEVYSANLGDGVIADCLTHALLSGPFASEVCYFDLAGRSGYSSLGIRGTAIRASRRHSIAFDAARVAKVVARRWMPDGRSWASNLRRSIKASDALLIGGGQLLIDNYLEFPVRISDVVKAARAQSKNVVFAFCGVGARWGRVASRLFEQSLCDDRVKLIATRDARSAERLQHRIPGVSTKTIAVADPGVLADEVYTRSEKQFDLGLGVTEIGVLRRHSERHRSISTEALIERWVELARLCCQHYETALFTNGSPKDDQFARAVADAFASRYGHRLILLPRATRPAELAAQISSFRMIVSHRLHANILAYAFGVPSVALGWDDKLDSFMSLTERSHMLVRSPLPDAHEVARLLDGISEPDVALHRVLKARVRAAAAELLSAASAEHTRAYDT